MLGHVNQSSTITTIKEVTAVVSLQGIGGGGNRLGGGSQLDGLQNKHFGGWSREGRDPRQTAEKVRRVHQIRAQRLYHTGHNQRKSVRQWSLIARCRNLPPVPDRQYRIHPSRCFPTAGPNSKR